MGNEMIILEMMKTTDSKIDIMEYIIEKMSDQPIEAQRQFVNHSSVFDRLDVLNLDFLQKYQKLLKVENVSEIGALASKYPAPLKDLKSLIAYAIELESALEAMLKKL